MRKWLFLCVILFCMTIVEAKVTLPKLFQSGMVLQRGKQIPVWGKAEAGELVTLRFNKKQYATSADMEGNWRINLPKMRAGGPYTMTVGDLVLTNILIGDVWLLSGQSNIDVTVERVYPQYTKDIDSYQNEDIRLFRVPNETDAHGVRDDITSPAINWKPANKENAWSFSAVGYFLGRRMYEETGVPQGIIVNSWGGTPIEAWISADSLQEDYPMLVKKAQFFQNDEYVKAQAQANMQADRQWQTILNSEDPGISEKWTAPDFDDSGWQEVNQYDNDWAKKNGRSVIGSLWLRQHVQIDKAHAGQPARLLLGTLYDQDVTYLNGQEIGHTYYQYPPRRYDIPEGLLREGDNVITVRFINKYGLAHFIPEKPYMLCFGDDRFSQNPMPADAIPLSEAWKFHLGAEMPPCPSGDISLQNVPTTLYNAVLHPLAPYALSGVVWYQGESNTGQPTLYADYLRKLMGCWRDRWNDQKMPFVIVQLANYDGRQQTGFPSPIIAQTAPVNSGWAQLREAQRVVAEGDPRAELAVINDLGETVDIHPLRKKEVAERIALGFDRLVYNNKVLLSPRVESSAIADQQIILTLDQPVESGDVYEFEVAADDGDRIFQSVQASAEGNTIILTLPDGFHPLSRIFAVRYAWKDNPTKANVRSLSGLPMSSFEKKVKR